MVEESENFIMKHKMNLEQRREYFLKRLMGQLKTISRYEENDRYSEKIFRKTEQRYRKAQRKFYKNKHKRK